MKPAVRSAVVLFALLASILTPGTGGAPAAELPMDTNVIKSLTPEEAKKLVAESGRQLGLCGLTSLSPEVAAVLAGFKGEGFCLDGLTTLSPEAASALAKLQLQSDSGNCWLSLNGLTSLTPETAKALAEFTGERLHLNGLTTLSPEAATALAGSQSNSLLLLRLTAITPEVATGLAGFRGKELNLGGLTTLSDEVAMAFAGAKCRALLLLSLTTLSPEAAMAFGKSAGWVCLPENVKKNFAARYPLSPDNAGAYVRVLGGRLSGVTSLDSPDSVAIARALAAYKGDMLVLDGLTALSPEAAMALAEYAGIIVVPENVHKKFGVKYPLSPDNARAYARVLNGNLSGVTALDSPDSVAIAEALATYKGRLSLPNLKKISPKTLSALLKKEDVQIPLIETLELIPEPDGSFTDDFVIPEGFKERQAR